MLPTGNMPGGAPVNVAIHLTYNGFSPAIISRVGKDELGNGLLAYVAQKGLSTQWIQTDETYPTGIVEANISNKTEVTYQIVQPVAWDYIAFDAAVAAMISRSDVFVYGCLSARNETTRNTLLQYVDAAPLKVFDVNFRPPHYTSDLIEQLLNTANIVKMNHHEMEEIMNWHGPHTDEQKSMEFLKTHYNLEMIIVTRGEKGAAVSDTKGYVEHAGYQVKVEDTIGSGDAFLATFLSGYLRGKSTSQALEQACRVGAFVATRKGATPEYDPAAIVF
jgi:fructokinase